jgi:hypothetical protein
MISTNKSEQKRLRIEETSHARKSHKIAQKDMKITQAKRRK